LIQVRVILPTLTLCAGYPAYFLPYMRVILPTCAGYPAYFLP